MRTRTDEIRDTDMANFVVVSVRLSRDDVDTLQKRSAEMGVGVSTYIRMLVRQHLAAKGAGTGSRRDAIDPFDHVSREVAATAERDVLAKAASGKRRLHVKYRNSLRRNVSPLDSRGKEPRRNNS